MRYIFSSLRYAIFAAMSTSFVKFSMLESALAFGRS